VSDESGRSEVYVRPSPDLGRKWQVSTQGGTEPRWRRNSRELFYRSEDKMMAVAVSSGSPAPFSKPAMLFERQYLRSRTTPVYDVAADGRFLMIRNEPGTGRLNLVVNWSEELKQRVPTR